MSDEEFAGAAGTPDRLRDVLVIDLLNRLERASEKVGADRVLHVNHPEFVKARAAQVTAEVALAGARQLIGEFKAKGRNGVLAELTKKKPRREPGLKYP